MKYDDIKFYLRSNLSNPSLEFEWRDEDNKGFFTFIKEKFPKKFLNEKENLLTIREAFASYFEPVGYILFKINKNEIKLKVFPYSVEVKKSKNVDKIINILDENKNSIVNSYKGKDDQIYLDSKLRNKIFSYIYTIEDEHVNAKELVRFSVRKGLELQNEDLIMLKEDCIFVKLCDITKKKKVADRRYNSIDEKEMQDFCEEHFKNKENKNFFFITAKLFVEKYFLEKNINNHEYEKKVFSLIQLIITEQLMNKFDHCEEFFKGFAGYIFRRNFTDVFEYIAELILYEVSISNNYMIDFLKYYSSNIIVINSKRYKTPSLETDGELKWNVISMLSIVKMYLKAKLAIKSMQYDIDKKNAEIMNLCVNGLSPVEYNDKNTEEKNKIIHILLDFERSIDNCYDSLKFAKNENEKKEIEKEIDLTKKHMQEMRKQKKELLNKSVKRSDINKFLELEKNVASISRRLEKEKKIFNQNKDSFESIKHALVKALISKKQLV
ncbi:hypothetical protein [Sulfurimonas sp.]